MHYVIEAKAALSADYWFLLNHTQRLGVTRRTCNAQKYSTVAEAKADVAKVIAMSHKDIRKLLGVDNDFDKTIGLNIYSVKDDNLTFNRIDNKLYLFHTAT